MSKLTSRMLLLFFRLPVKMLKGLTNCESHRSWQSAFLTSPAATMSAGGSKKQVSLSSGQAKSPLKTCSTIGLNHSFLPASLVRLQSATFSPLTLDCVGRRRNVIHFVGEKVKW